MTEPEAPMARKLERRLADAHLPVSVVQAPAERMSFGDEVFDSVVSTLVLCTVDDLVAALQEIRRVMKPDGRLLFLEHVRSDDPRLARWQDRLERIWVSLGQGCHCNRRTLESIRDVGFSAPGVRRDEMRGTLPIVRPLVVGSAVAAGQRAA
jgi:ubiquinone/menaquinone biosynthesis C-methylase UbiE